MQIECKRCHYEYDYQLYGETCPQCGSENQPFRSAGARRTLGLDEPRIGYFDVKEREQRARVADPMYGKSPLQRLKPYLMILVFLCGVVFLGNALMKYARQGTSPFAPPSASAALGVEGYAFAPAGGMRLTVNAASVVPKASAPAGEKWVYVELTLDVIDHAAAQQEVFVPPVLAGGETVAMPEPPDETWGAEQTMFDSTAIANSERVRGRLFYRLPENLRAVTLFYQQDGSKQQMQLTFDD